MRRIRIKGFTLVEMMVVVGIATVLAAIMLPALNKVLQMSWETKAREDIHQITTCWNTYLTDYRQFPTDQTGNQDLLVDITEMNSNSIAILNGQKFGVSASRSYIECTTNEIINGMLDPWGVKMFKKGDPDWQNRRYQIVLDNGLGYDTTDAYDGKVTVPHRGSVPFYVSVMGWSRGKDGRDSTVKERKDDVLSK